MHGSPATPLENADLTMAILTGVFIATQCALLSVLVVLKRMAFIGQGISHAALGGVGIAAVLGIMDGPWYFLIVGAVCVLAALLVGWMQDRKAIASDTAIGIVLVASMALGVTLLSIAEGAAEAAHDHAHAHESASGHEWEELLFGSLTDVGMFDAIVAGVLLLITLALALRFGRAILFWAFDERSACAFGAPTGAVQVGLMIALAATILASMKLVGVILATALLVLPGACALRLANQLPAVLTISIGTSLLALAVGLASAAAFTIPVGGAVVLALVVCYTLTWPLSRIKASGAGDPPNPPQRTST